MTDKPGRQDDDSGTYNNFKTRIGILFCNVVNGVNGVISSKCGNLTIEREHNGSITLSKRAAELLTGIIQSPTRDGAEGAIAGPIAFDPEMLRRDALIREDIAPPNPAPDALHHNDGDDFLTQARKTIGHLSHAADVVSGKPAHDAMRKALTPSEKVETEIVAQLVLQWAENPEMRLHRARCQSLLDIIGRLSAPVPPADGAVTRESIAQELVLYERWTILDETTRAMIHRAISFILNLPSSPAVAAEPGKRWHVGAQNDGIFIVNAEPRPSNDHPWHDNPNGPTVALNVTELPLAKAQKIVDVMNSLALPTVRGDREVIACIIDPTAFVTDDLGNWYLESVSRRGSAMAKAGSILSLPVQSGADEREAAIAKASALARKLCQLFDSGGESQRTVRARHASAIFQLLGSYETEQRQCDADPVGYLERCERLALARQAPHSSSETE